MTLPASDDEILLLHNPRCSKSRATEALLQERGLTFTVRAYLDDPLDRDELSELQARLGRPARETNTARPTSTPTRPTARSSTRWPARRS